MLFCLEGHDEEEEEEEGEGGGTPQSEDDHHVFAEDRTLLCCLPDSLSLSVSSLGTIPSFSPFAINQRYLSTDVRRHHPRGDHCDSRPSCALSPLLAVAVAGPIVVRPCVILFSPGLSDVLKSAAWRAGLGVEMAIPAVRFFCSVLSYCCYKSEHVALCGLCRAWN